MADDNIQHGIDDNTQNDPEKGAALGGLGGAAVGAAAGSMTGPVGTVVGAVVGGLAGAGASGAAVSAVDNVDNDNTITGVGDGATRDVNATSTGDASVNAAYPSPSTGTVGVTNADVSDVNADRTGIGDDVPGVRSGG